ncbi:MAG: hypothetical protein ABR555_04265 [Pyrinomonadaceae bacterium]
MTYLRFPSIALVIATLFTVTTIPAIAAGVADPQGQSTAFERGYRTGYSDGYNAGFRDVTSHAARDYQTKDEYQKADRSYNDVWGPLEDYRDGYQQGFEVGYAAGYERRDFNSTIPAGLKKREQGASRRADSQTNTTTPANPIDNGTVNTASTPANGVWSIPRNTILGLELQTPLSTDATQRGDRFEARVTEPSEYAGAVVVGRVTQVKRAGKVKGVSQLQLAFDQIRFPDNRSVTLHAELIEVLPLPGAERTEIDPEGGVRSRDRTKDDVSKVGAATGVGAIIGAIAGGGKGAAIGAVIGGAAGTGAVVTQRGRDIHLDRGQQLRIRTSTDTTSL